MVRLIGPGRIAIQSQYGFEGEAHWVWDDLPNSGSWRNWNPDTSHWQAKLATASRNRRRSATSSTRQAKHAISIPLPNGYVLHDLRPIAKRR
jgi:hypothetical protein